MVVYLQTTTAEANGGAGAIRYLPLALVLAATNSFAEEMLYRGVLFGPLLRQVTANQAISMTAVLFGIAHYHGTPSGFPGMALTFIAGWVFGLARVETRSTPAPVVPAFCSRRGDVRHQRSPQLITLSSFDATNSSQCSLSAASAFGQKIDAKKIGPESLHIRTLSAQDSLISIIIGSSFPSERISFRVD